MIVQLCQTCHGSWNTQHMCRLVGAGGVWQVSQVCVCVCVCGGGGAGGGHEQHLMGKEEPHDPLCDC